MIKDILLFVCGVYIGQEYGNTVPSVKLASASLYKTFIDSKFYEKLKKDFTSEKNK